MDHPGRAAVPVTIGVLVVDDDRLAREAIVSYLAPAPDIRVVGECSSGAQVEAALAGTKVDVVLLDVHMPGMGGFDVMGALRTRPEAPRILVLTSLGDEDTMMAAVAAGATGFLSKDTGAEGFADAVRATHRGLTVLSRVPPARRQQPAAAPPVDTSDFNERELEVLRLLCRGLSNKEIAQRLYLSESSVKGYTSSVLAKLDAPTRLRAVVRAFELGLAAEPT